MNLRNLLNVLFISSIFTGNVFASEAHIVNISVKESYSMLSASANLEGAFTKETEEAFMSGMPVMFTFYIKLTRNRSYWWDAREKTLKVHKIVKYDSFVKEFNAIEIIADSPPKAKEFDNLLASIKKSHGDTLFSEKQMSAEDWTRRYLKLKNLPALERWITRLRDIPLGNKMDYPPDAKYYLEVRAEMDTIKLTPPFNYIFFFISFLNFDTEWETSSPFMIVQGNPPIDRMLVRKSK